ALSAGAQPQLAPPRGEIRMVGVLPEVLLDGRAAGRGSRGDWRDRVPRRGAAGESFECLSILVRPEPGIQDRSGRPAARPADGVRRWRSSGNRSDRGVDRTESWSEIGVTAPDV